MLSQMALEEAEPGASSPCETVAGGVESQKILEAIGSRVISLTHCFFRKARHLPCLVGPTVAVMEDIVSPHLQPLVSSMENRGLFLLSLVDEQLYTVGGAVEKNVPFASTLVWKVQKLHNLSGQATGAIVTAVGRVKDCGVIGATADTWLEYESLVKTKSQQALQYAGKFPLLNIIVPIVHAVGAPVASAVSDWLIKQSEIQDKHLILQEVHLPAIENEVKRSSDENHFFVVEHVAEEALTIQDAENIVMKVSEDADKSETLEGDQHVGVVRHSDLLKEVEPLGDVVPAQTDVKIVVPISYSDDESDDELTVLFNSGWSLGKIGSVHTSPAALQKPKKQGRFKGIWGN